MPHDLKEPRVGGAKLAGQDALALQPEKPLFSTVELRLIRYTVVLLCLVTLTALIGIILWSLSRVLQVFYSLLLSLAVAGILALVLQPVVLFLEHRLHLHRLLAISFVLLAFFMGIGALFLMLIPTMVNQAIQLMTILPATLESWQDHVNFYFPELSAMVTARIESRAAGTAQSGAENSGTNIMSYLGVLAGIGFVPLFLFFALLSGNSLRAQVSEVLSVFHKPTQNKVLYFIDVFVGYIRAFFQGQLVIAMTMGAMYALGFMMIGLEFGVLAGAVLGLLNIIPFLGTLIGLLVILPMAFLQADGGIDLLLMALTVFVVVQVIESWLLTPKIMANHTGLHPALVVISLFFWGIVFGGIIGMVLAVPLTAFFVAIWGEIKASLKRTLSSRDTRS